MPSHISTLACGDGGASIANERATPVLDACGGPDHPCTLGEVSPEAEARTAALAEAVLERLHSPEQLDEAAAWLSQQTDIVSVAVGPEAVRFRVRGGRAHWIFLQTAGTLATLSAPTLPKPLATPAAAAAVAAAELTPAQSSSQRPIKRALLLSPFRWQWQVEGGDDGIDDIARALRARDYVDVTVWTERLDPADQTHTIGEIGLDAFTSWQDYDYVHLLTHGGRACNPMGHCMTAVMAPWTKEAVLRARAGAEYAGNAKLAELLDRVGVETAKVRVMATKDRIPSVGLGQVSREDIPLTERHKPAHLQQAYTLTGEFILLTSQFFRDTYTTGVDSAVIVISACSSGAKNDLLDALRGEATAVIGWRDAMSLRAAAVAGTLIAQTLVEVDDRIEDESGLSVGQAMQRIRARLDELARDPPDYRTCANPSDPQVQARCDLASKAQVLTIINDMPADAVTGASLQILGDTTVRAREIVYLLAESGDDLPDGGVLRVIGAPGDGRPDSVDLTIRVDGLGLEDDPRAVEMKILFESREIRVHKPLDVEVAAGVWQLNYRLPIGRDHMEGERVDVEVVALLPEGGESRWIYDDIRLGGTYWTLTLGGGPRAGTYAGSGTDVRTPIAFYSPLMPAHALRQMGVGIVAIDFFGDDVDEPTVFMTVKLASREPGAGADRPGTHALGMAEAEILFERDRLLRGEFENIPDARCHRSYITGDGRDHGVGGPFPSPATLTITSIDHDWVSGTIDGTLLTLCGEGSRHEDVPVHVEFHARRCLAGNSEDCVPIPAFLR